MLQQDSFSAYNDPPDIGEDNEEDHLTVDPLLCRYAVNDAAIIVLFAGEHKRAIACLLCRCLMCHYTGSGSGCMCLTQRCCHAVVALEIKWKAPKAHTLLELVYVRWGKIAHVVSPCPLTRSVAHSTRRLSVCCIMSVELQAVVSVQVFFVFAVVTNLLVSLSMLQGNFADPA